MRVPSPVHFSGSFLWSRVYHASWDVHIAGNNDMLHRHPQSDQTELFPHCHPFGQPSRKCFCTGTDHQLIDSSDDTSQIHDTEQQKRVSTADLLEYSREYVRVAD